MINDDGFPQRSDLNPGISKAVFDIRRETDQSSTTARSKMVEVGQTERERERKRQGKNEKTAQKTGGGLWVVGGGGGCRLRIVVENFRCSG